MFSRTALALLVISLPALAYAEDASPMQEGLWEISMKIEIPGLPFQMPPQTVQHCYTKKDLQESAGVPKQEGDCKVTDLKRTGNKVTWKTACKGKDGSGTGEMTFKGATASEGMVKMDAGGKATTTRYEGKRLGDCK